MKPGNLLILGAKSGGETIDEDAERSFMRSESRSAFFVSAERRGSVFVFGCDRKERIKNGKKTVYF